MCLTRVWARTTAQLPNKEDAGRKGMRSGWDKTGYKGGQAGKGVGWLVGSCVCVEGRIKLEVKHTTGVSHLFKGGKSRSQGAEVWSSPPDDEMGPLGRQNLVENAGTGVAGPGSWKDWMTLQQQPATEQQHLFQLMADQQRVMLDQMATAQAQTNKQLWEQCPEQK